MPDRRFIGYILGQPLLRRFWWPRAWRIRGNGHVRLMLYMPRYRLLSWWRSRKWWSSTVVERRSGLLRFGRW